MSEQLGKSEPFGKPSASSSSYGGNPLAATAVAETIKIIKEDRLVENSRKVGGQMLHRLNTLKEKYEFIGDVRGKGLLIGIDLVRDLKTREPLSRKITEQIFMEALRRGIVTMTYFPRVRINPPLVITEEQAETGVAILDEVFAHVRDHLDWRAA
jgi:4-aminobutyrate aminotransferase-like enzyme